MPSPSILYHGIVKAIQDVLRTNDDDMAYMVPVMWYYVDEGKAFVTSEVFESLASGSSVDVLFSNPPGSGVEVRVMMIRVTALANGRIYIYRNVGMTSNGTPIPTFNLNMGVSNESKVTVEYGGTYDTTGINPSLKEALPGGSKKEAIGALVVLGEHGKMPPGNNIMLTITNTSAASADYSVKFVWLEQ